MSRQRRFLDIDVLTAARQRIAHIYETFDSVVVMFSGGKDSQTCLHLCKAEAERRGALPVNAIFLDEELLSRSVIETVDSYRRMPWVSLRWFCVPMRNTKKALNTTEEIVTWGPGRRHVREMPEWGIKLPEGDTRVFRQQDMDGFTSEAYSGRIAYVLGLRASESLNRFRAVVSKLNENYITASSHPRVKLAKPIYDWSDKDVFKFLGESGIPCDESYRAKLYAGGRLRVSTPLHGEAAKVFHLLAAEDPELYQNILDVWPEMGLHARYHQELNDRGDYDKYGDGMEGCRRYIDDFYPEGFKRAQALKLYNNTEARRRTNPEQFPASLLLDHLIKGILHRTLRPIPMRDLKRKTS